MVAETNDVWYWNHPNIDYWVSQQSLVYIKHSPVTGWPAGVILIIRRRNMACSATQGREAQWAACCLLHLAPGSHSHVCFPSKAFCNLTSNNRLTWFENWCRLEAAFRNYFGAWMPNMSSSQAHYHIAIQTYKSLDWYSTEWAERELYLAAAMLVCFLYRSGEGMTSYCSLS